MSGRRQTTWLAAFSLLLLTALGGYLIGSGGAVGRSEADQAREEAFRQARDRTTGNVARIAARRGYRAGMKRGRVAGTQLGEREGMRFGAGTASLQAVDQEIGAARAAAAAARSEISARQANCGVVAKAPDWCPTADELAAWRATVEAARQAAKPPEEDGREGR
ncbi:MAG: hypothetical protein M9938_01325 [Solirubrobacterales bacterium]|nr:hypothetical protein [Solirubrobacterales bacterium]